MVWYYPDGVHKGRGGVQMSWQAVVLIIFGGIVVLGVIAIIAVWAMWSKASDAIKHEMKKEERNE